MIKARATLKDDRPLYLFGLSDMNLEKLKQGLPIEIHLESLDGVGDVLIFHGKTEEDIAHTFRELIGPETVVTGRAHLDD